MCVLDRLSPITPGYQARCSFCPMPSRQERRKAEREAAKRAPAQAGAAGTGCAASARVNMNVNPGGDWSTQASDYNLLFRAFGAEIVEQMSSDGDRQAQFSLGCRIMAEAEGVAGTPLSTTGRSPKADVGLALRTAQFPLTHTMRRLVT